ncbi:phosphoenolpyruvate carboxykinase (ATP) [Gluconacetobacter diazotrophicus]|uniref:Phosphoenolpyruvate carboxykinase (ATP) n=1 Tax=Gluconacetobacter diazotrophicus (strain ATCC 49037 / DSM 5601 / CCUG 37298 / CIP 103539 / LMG 7603 / PAl5) TaxID=272568 RepID=A9H8M9_GLUDA|nr:phosphoenolpyruvate carboxykinase (ATP) [Gluconacetobacter diazotrophicus]CAP54553.1 Phosphoenolpyruvate carboxykinase [Gluconacetobacter diazotrophicus PA1 5]
MKNKNGFRPAGSDSVLAGTGLRHAGPVHANLHAPELTECAIRRGEGSLSAGGALMVRTGVHTGRSAQDKFIVDEPATRAGIWWGDINMPLPVAAFQRVCDHARGYLEGQELFTQDLYAGADPAHRIRIRLVTTSAWHALFARNMFIRPPAADLPGFQPDYVILHAPELDLDPAVHGVRSSTGVILSLEQRLIVIAGTGYAGEIKKSIFTAMNWLLPDQDVMPMHCSANIGPDGDVALFFGLSGTGKTTLSSDASRHLIGDDEHGWSGRGVFNIEGGCYAKVIGLRQAAEPEIWDASRHFGAVLENVVADAHGVPDFADGSLTENTRACYPIDFVANASADGQGGLPRHVVMLTADAFGVLPPIARLTPAQAVYHFLSGYTARIAGTEKGLGKEPQATFSACFGAPFLPRPPELYGDRLAACLARVPVTCWLVNTGWTGGPYGVGDRISLAHTRALVNAALDGRLDDAPFQVEPHFGLSIPARVPGIPAALLDPAAAWADPDAYRHAASDLAARFERNFAAFHARCTPDIQAAAIRPVRP